jgi:hypothetical protein
MNETKEEKTIIDIITDEYKKGNVVYTSIEGPMVVELNHFLSQSIDGILYDLNRSEEIVLSCIDKNSDPKWVNDYAVAKVIRVLYERNEKMLKELKKIYKLEDDEEYDSGKLRDLVLEIENKKLPENTDES